MTSATHEYPTNAGKGISAISTISSISGIIPLSAVNRKLEIEKLLPLTPRLIHYSSIDLEAHDLYLSISFRIITTWISLKSKPHSPAWYHLR
jgi:hypothetical protein